MQSRENPQAGNLPSVMDALNCHRAELTSRHVKHVWVFGSVARGEDCEGSDVDLIVEIDPEFGMSLTGLSRLRLDLVDMLGRDVDLGDWSTLREEIVDDVRRDAVMVF